MIQLVVPRTLPRRTIRTRHVMIGNAAHKEKINLIGRRPCETRRVHLARAYEAFYRGLSFINRLV